MGLLSRLLHLFSRSEKASRNDANKNRVPRYSVTVKINSSSCVYDGVEHHVAAESLSIPKGLSIEFGKMPSFVNASDKPYVVTEVPCILRNKKGKDVTPLASIEFVPGSIEIKKAFQIVQLPNIEKEYDGKPWDPRIAPPEGVRLAFNCDDYPIDAGLYQLPYVAHRENYQDYEGNMRLTIRPKKAFVVVDDAKKEYDGEPLAVVGHIEGLLDGEKADIVFSHAPIVPGDCSCDYQIIWGFGAKPGNYALEELLGKLEIEEYSGEIEIRLSSYRGVYDGDSHRSSIEIVGLPDCYTVAEAYSEESVTHVYDGAVGTRCSKLKICNRVGTDVTSKLNLKIIPGSLCVLPRPIVVTALSAKKVYDGSPLCCKQVFVTNAAAENELVVRTRGMQQEAGIAENVPYIDWDSSNGAMSDYSPTFINGKLEVEPATLELLSSSCEYEYDGDDHYAIVNTDPKAEIEFLGDASFSSTGVHQVKFIARKENYRLLSDTATVKILPPCKVVHVLVKGGEFEYDGLDHGATVLVEDLPAGYVLEKASSLARVRDVEQGEMEARCDLLVISDAQGNDVTNELNIEFHQETISIVPAQLMITTFSAEREFDGQALTSSGVLSGLVDDESVSFEVTGSQTDVGESLNTYSLLFNGTAKESNYKIVEALGKLVVLQSVVSEEEAESAVVEEQIEENVDESRAGITVTDETETALKHVVAAVVEKSKPQVQKPSRYDDKPVLTGSATLWAEARKTPRKPRSVTPLNQKETLSEQGFDTYDPYPNISVPSSPRDRFWFTLVSNESKARTALNDLLEDEPNGLVFQVFREFSTELGEIRESFIKLFAYYSDQSLAIKLVFGRIPDLFCVFVSDLARTEYSGRDLWQNVFGKIGIRQQAVQAKFKELYISILFRRGMTLFDRDPKRNYLQYTALLHGGLSEDLWRCLWLDSFLPIAKDLRSVLPKYGSLYDAAAIRELLDTEAYRPKKEAAYNVIKMSPDGSLESICESAIKVALQTLESSQMKGVKMLTSYGLPDNAMQALRSVLENRDARGKTKERIVYFDQAELVLDITEGVVKIRWGKYQFPKDFAEYRVDYFVNGIKMATKKILPFATRSILEETIISVSPAESYEAEIRLNQINENLADVEEIDSLNQVFKRSHPGCLEFLRDPSGVYRLRKGQAALRKTRDVAFMVRPGCDIAPVRGMTLVNRISGTGKWCGFSIVEFEVNPGASAALIDAQTGAELSAWNDRFAVHVDKTFAIGETADGVDLYGFIGDSFGANVALPSVSINMPRDWTSDQEQLLEAKCFCAGKELSLEQSQDYISDKNSDRVLRIEFSGSKEFPPIAKQCELVVADKETGDRVLRYDFAIAPIQGFHLEDGKVLLKESKGIYQFDACLEMTVSDEDGSQETIATGQAYYFEKALSQESALLSIRTSVPEEQMGIRLGLAGISISASEALVMEEAGGPISLATLDRVGLSGGGVTISTVGRRPERTIAVKIGDNILAYKRLEGPSGLTLNLFERPEIFALSGKGESEMPLVVTVSFGHTVQNEDSRVALADLRFLNCVEGYNLGRARIVTTKEGVHRIRFDVKTTCELSVELASPKKGHVETFFLDEGCNHVDLSREVWKRICGWKDIDVRVAPVSFFGEPDVTRMVAYKIKRHGSAQR